MLTCPQCQHQELEGALYCSRCGAALFDASDTGTIASAELRDELKEALSKPAVVPAFPDPPPGQESSCCAALLLDEEKTFFLEDNRNYTIGRASEGQAVLPDIDLAPYRGYEAGVSRLHAMLSLQGGRASIKDLGSANGTRLNGQFIPPRAERSLSHGDILTLGKLKLQILLRS